MVEVNECFDLRVRPRFGLLVCCRSVKILTMKVPEGYTLTCVDVLLVRPETQQMSPIDPFCDGVEQQQEFEFFIKRLLLALECACLAINGEPAYLTILDEFQVAKARVE